MPESDSLLISLLKKWEQEGLLKPGDWLSVWWPEGSQPQFLACHPQRQRLSSMTVRVWKDLYLVRYPC